MVKILKKVLWVKGKHPIIFFESNKSTSYMFASSVINGYLATQGLAGLDRQSSYQKWEKPPRWYVPVLAQFIAAILGHNRMSDILLWLLFELEMQCSRTSHCCAFYLLIKGFFYYSLPPSSSQQPQNFFSNSYGNDWEE